MYGSDPEQQPVNLKRQGQVFGAPPGNFVGTERFGPAGKKC